MSIVVAILLVTGGVLTAFLYPRSVDVSILSINSTADYINTLTAFSKNDTDTAILEIEVQINKFLAMLKSWVECAWGETEKHGIVIMGPELKFNVIDLSNCGVLVRINFVCFYFSGRPKLRSKMPTSFLC